MGMERGGGQGDGDVKNDDNDDGRRRRGGEGGEGGDVIGGMRGR